MATSPEVITVTGRRPGMQVFEPECRITLIKCRRRSSLGSPSTATGAEGAIPPAGRLGDLELLDLTGFLSDRGGVRTQKSVRGPAGSFSLTLEDRPVLGDTVYGLIEPQDIIEIRMSRQAGTALPVVMRGLVSSITRDESIEGGTPSRLVTVSGMDFGKILQQLRIYYLPGSIVGEIWLDQFKFFRQFDAEAKQMTASAFLSLIVDKVLNPYLSKMLYAVQGLGKVVALPNAFKAKASIVGVVSPIGVAAFSGGSVYDLLAQFLDVGAFNELYVDDWDDSVDLVCRPAPWQNLKGDPIDPAGVTQSVQITDSQLISLRVSRTDAGVANYFWCSNGRYELLNNGRLKLDALTTDRANYTAFNYVNTDVRLYGVRKMEVESQLGDPRLLAGDGPSAGLLTAERAAMDTWLSNRRAVLAASNLDNVVLESGSMRLRGTAAVRAGMYIELTRGSATSRMYAVSVSHEFMPGQEGGVYVTSVEFTRGTGFVKRQQAGAPWLSERNERGAS